ncbi:MAG TPA: hypothetical protein VMP08_26730 [Anaerolineae bacterium]|nr:hypothetical protein [Anaerolineae bacterium]
MLLLTACNAGGGPAIQAARDWMQALADLNFKQVLDLTCSTPRIHNDVEVRLDPLIDIQETLQSLKGQYDFSGLKFEELSNDGRTATVRLSGKLLLKVLGQEQAYEIYEEVSVVKEGDTWKLCSNAANLLPRQNP